MHHTGRLVVTFAECMGHGDLHKSFSDEGCLPVLRKKDKSNQKQNGM